MVPNHCLIDIGVHIYKHVSGKSHHLGAIKDGNGGFKNILLVFNKIQGQEVSQEGIMGAMAFQKET